MVDVFCKDLNPEASILKASNLKEPEVAVLGEEPLTPSSRQDQFRDFPEDCSINAIGKGKRFYKRR